MSDRRQTRSARLGALVALALATIAALAVSLTADASQADAAARSYKLGQRELRLGSKGSDVRVLQWSLFKLKYPATVDGVFGPGTKRIVKAYELKRKIPVDGVVQRAEGRRIKAAAKKAPAPPAASGTEVFPVRGTHNFGGPEAAFGAPRNGHTHQGQDIFAACGTPIVAAHGGLVRTSNFQSGGAGFYVVIRSGLSGEDHMYAHLSAPATVYAGLPIAAGTQFGTVGDTGDAVGCHLHFEMWTKPGWYLGGAPYNPLPSLLYWDSIS
jgi:murein DD-endopeptidase MepM/ murein hydrolase activator NlpD